MCNSAWNIKEFRKLFKAKYGDSLLSRLENYIITLDWKKKKAQYHADRVDEYWVLLMKRLRWIPIISNPYFIEARYRSAFEMEAMIQTLHSLGDILLQIVNLVGDNPLDESKVNFDKVCRKIPKSCTLEEKLLKFKNSQEWKYCEAFCNTIKHISLIDNDFCIYSGHARREGQTGFRFKEFTYKNQKYEVTAFRDIKNKYRDNLFEKFRDVGIELNNFVHKGVRS